MQPTDTQHVQGQEAAPARKKQQHTQQATASLSCWWVGWQQIHCANPPTTKPARSSSLTCVDVRLALGALPYSPPSNNRRMAGGVSFAARSSGAHSPSPAGGLAGQQRHCACIPPPSRAAAAALACVDPRQGQLPFLSTLAIQPTHQQHVLDWEAAPASGHRHPTQV
jgi:hypothetical protein